MNRTKIEYLDYTLNYYVGCRGIDCAVREHCWAMAMAKRQSCDLCKRFVPHVHSSRWIEPFQKRKSSRIGLNFMSDTFDRDIIHHLGFHEMWVMIEKCFWHTFVILTKQPQNIPSWLTFPKNVWLGVTINRKEDLWRLEKLKQVDAAIRFVSFEPLYEDLTNVSLDILKGIDWIIIGAQTRPNMQPKREWVENLIETADMLHIPVFLKNNLDFPYKTQEFPMCSESRGTHLKLSRGGCSS